MTDERDNPTHNPEKTLAAEFSGSEAALAAQLSGPLSEESKEAVAAEAAAKSAEPSGTTFSPAEQIAIEAAAQSEPESAFVSTAEGPQTGPPTAPVFGPEAVEAVHGGVLAEAAPEAGTSLQAEAAPIAADDSDAALRERRMDRPQGAETEGPREVEEPGAQLVPPSTGEQPVQAEPTEGGPVQEKLVEEHPAETPAPPEAAAEKPSQGPEEEAKASPQKPKSANMQWYIVKVQSNREDSIREGLLRRVRQRGLDEYFGEVIVPVEKVVEFKGGKRRVAKRKLYPGYLVVQMEITEETWFLVRETPGIGDFTGAAGRPTPMLAHEVARILAKKDEKADEAPKPDIKFRAGDRVKINEGTFENFEGEIGSIDQTTGRVTVMINIFGRSTPVELGYWQIESV